MNIISADARHPDLSTPIHALSPATLAAWRAAQPATTAAWLDAHQFKAAPGQWLPLPGSDGAIAAIAAGVGDAPDLWSLAHLPVALPPGDYRIATLPPALDADAAALGFGLGGYQFTRYRAAKRVPARLVVPHARLSAGLDADVAAQTLGRDLVNTAAEDMGPAELAQAARGVAEATGATFREWVGDALLEANFPSIHAVGRASPRLPRLVELVHGDADAPTVALVGKGVCFDTGGLDLKPADGMRWMKKDMGGAAFALALFQRLVAARLPIRLRLLLACVENAVAGNAIRPGDVLITRAGLSVEIDNTDAEGRVILADALSFAAEDAPDLILDFATLTGAARIALGPDLPALFANRDALADGLLDAGRAVADPLWRMPLHRGYRGMLDSHIADFANAGPSRLAGAITAALYLERFVPDAQPWAHLDVYCWNDADRPGRPRGGEAQGLRAYGAWLIARYRRGTGPAG